MIADTTVSTPFGRVGYRLFGSGRSALLLTGFGASVADWDPRLLAPLSDRRRLILIDNPGVGRTALGARPASVSGFASSIAGAIEAVVGDDTGVPAGPIDVIGWSMGGMIAQALAVLRPDLVRSLVLAASAPGTGGAHGPTPDGLRALGGDTGALIEALFPRDRSAAAAFVTAIGAHDSHDPVSVETLAAQVEAVHAWRAGRDPAGPRTAEIDVPILLADGALDPISPTVDAAALAAVFGHAQRATWPDGGHGFLFSDPVGAAGRIIDFWEKTR